MKPGAHLGYIYCIGQNLSQETETVLGISERIEYRALFAKMLLGQKNKKGKYKCWNHKT